MIITSLSFTDCDNEMVYELENVEYSLSPKKDVYDLADSISLTYSFEADSENFKEYIFYITRYNKISVYDEFGQDVTNKKIHYTPSENSKIRKTFTLVPQMPEDCFIRAEVVGILKEKTNDIYESTKEFHFTVK